MSVTVHKIDATESAYRKLVEGLNELTAELVELKAELKIREGRPVARVFSREITSANLIADLDSLKVELDELRK